MPEFPPVTMMILPSRSGISFKEYFDAGGKLWETREKRIPIVQ
jgi:hypothetical protein